MESMTISNSRYWGAILFHFILLFLTACITDYSYQYLYSYSGFCFNILWPTFLTIIMMGVLIVQKYFNWPVTIKFEERSVMIENRFFFWTVTYKIECDSAIANVNSKGKLKSLLYEDEVYRFNSGLWRKKEKMALLNALEQRNVKVVKSGIRAN